MAKTNSTLLHKINDMLDELDNGLGLLHKLCIARELECYVPLGDDFDNLVEMIYDTWLKTDVDLIALSAEVAANYKNAGDLKALLRDALEEVK